MDLGKQAGAQGLYDGLSPAELLDSLSTEIRVRKASQIREWIGIISWADDNVVDTAEDAATITEGYLDTGVPIAGPGAPLVSEFGLMELIATLERTLMVVGSTSGRSSSARGGSRRLTRRCWPGRSRPGGPRRSPS